MTKAKPSVTELSPRPRAANGSDASDVREVLRVAGLVEEGGVVVLAAVRVDDEHDLARDDDGRAERPRRLLRPRLDVQLDARLALEVDAQGAQRLFQRRQEALRREVRIELRRAEEIGEVAPVGVRRRDADALQVAPQLRAVRRVAAPEERLQRRGQRRRATAGRRLRRARRSRRSRGRAPRRAGRPSVPRAAGSAPPSARCAGRRSRGDARRPPRWR